MFCSKCGKPINNNACFCTFCGTPVAAANNPVSDLAEAVPLSSEPEISPVSLTAVNSGSVGGGFSDSTSNQSDTSYSDGANPVFNDLRTLPENPVEPPAPTQSIIPPLSSAPLAAELGAPVSEPIVNAENTAPVVTAAPAEALSDYPAPQFEPDANAPQKSGKTYTFGHIALCLAAVGVMAIVAGVFAGLYFSVI